jgi:hypothetical protein
VKARRDRSLVVSTDGGLAVLLSERVDLFRPGPKGGLYTAEDFQREHGFAPASLALFRALTGDRSGQVAGLRHFPAKVARRLAAACGTADRLYEGLRRPDPPDSLGALTALQLRKLRDGEAEVRANARLLDLAGVAGEPHLTLPPRDFRPLRDLLIPLQLRDLAAAVEAEFLVGPVRYGAPGRAGAG